MVLGLIKYGLSKSYPGKRFLSRRPDLKPAYDIVIIGGANLYRELISSR